MPRLYCQYQIGGAAVGANVTLVMNISFVCIDWLTNAFKSWVHLLQFNNKMLAFDDVKKYYTITVFRFGIFDLGPDIC